MTDDNAGHYGEGNGLAFATHPNVARQAIQRQAQALDEPDHGPDQDQHRAEDQ